MRYLITDDSRHILATLDVPPDETLSVAIERADEPDLLYVSADLHSDGSVHVGHWPEGQEWEAVLRTHGVPNPYGHGTSARPAELMYTRDAIVRALDTARDRARGLTGDTDALDVLVGGTLAQLTRSGSQYPTPDDEADANLATGEPTQTVTVRKTGDHYVSEFSALPGRTFGPRDVPDMIHDLTVSALLEPRAARDLVMNAATTGTATATTNR